MNPFVHPKAHVAGLLLAAINKLNPNIAEVTLERPRQAEHGDFACSIALQMAKQLQRSPRQVAEQIVAGLDASEWVDTIDIAGPGFINITLKPLAWQQVAAHAFISGERFGRGQQPEPARVQVEFVSANPTGPLHVGHGRGAAYGASLANVLSHAGFDVQREYYVNDAGRQMDILALSTWLRYLELCGEALQFPENAYQGDYVRTMAKSLQVLHDRRYLRTTSEIYTGLPDATVDAEGHLDGLIANAKRLLGADYAFVHSLVLEEQLGDCRNDLSEFGIEFDTWFSEKTLHDSGMIDRAIEALQKHNHIYAQDGALWFRSTAFGDEKDRVVRRDNGVYTYFAADIAYHLNKFERGFDRVIDIWGADHHGYVPRVKGAITAAGQDAERLTIALVQFAVLYRNGQKASMSTRSGEYVTLRNLRHEVGNDAARFFYVLRKSDQHLDFDLDLAKSQSNDNPVYYIQYAHARVSSVLASWGGMESDLSDADSSLLVHPHELIVLKRLAEFPSVIDSSARELAPHQLAYYLKDLAADLHGLYASCQFLVEDEALRHARLLLIASTRKVLRLGLQLLGVSAPDKM